MEGGGGAGCLVRKMKMAGYQVKDGDSHCGEWDGIWIDHGNGNTGAAHLMGFGKGSRGALAHLNLMQLTVWPGTAWNRSPIATKFSSQRYRTHHRYHSSSIQTHLPLIRRHGLPQSAKLEIHPGGLALVRHMSTPNAGTRAPFPPFSKHHDDSHSPTQNDSKNDYYHQGGDHGCAICVYHGVLPCYRCSEDQYG